MDNEDSEQPVTVTINNIEFKKVEGWTRNSIPNEDETFFTDFDKDKFSLGDITNFIIYQRDPRDCPLGEGNWILEFTFKDTSIYYIKLPYEMEEKAVMRFTKPLIDELQKRKIKNYN